MADINKYRSEVAEMILSIGDRRDLDTRNKTTLVGAINEIRAEKSEVGDMSLLITENKDTVVDALNETYTLADSKVTRPNSATAGNVAIFDSNQNILDAGVSIATLADNQAIIDDYQE